MTTIYDLGCNNGDDLDYYLLKADRVVAVEANPVLCEKIVTRFSREIASGRLFVENCAIIDKEVGIVDFFIHLRYDILSSLIQPSHNLEDWQKISIRALTLSQLIDKYGSPYYIKIDLEGYDEVILSELVNFGIKPKYISAEAHTLGVFVLLAEKLGYNCFKLVEGWSVSKEYFKKKFYSFTTKRFSVHSFPHSSAGPFGEDVNGKWYDKDSFLKILAMKGLGWKDIHATTEAIPKRIKPLVYWTAISEYTAFLPIYALKTRVRRATKMATQLLKAI